MKIKLDHPVGGSCCRGYAVTHYQDPTMDARVACGAYAYGRGAPLPVVASVTYTSCRACLDALRDLVERRIQQLQQEESKSK